MFNPSGMLRPIQSSHLYGKAYPLLVSGSLERLDESVNDAFRILPLHRAICIKDEQKLQPVPLQPVPMLRFAVGVLRKPQYVRDDPDSLRKHPTEWRGRELRDDPDLVVAAINHLPPWIGVLLFPRQMDNVEPRARILRRRHSEQITTFMRIGDEDVGVR